MVIGLLWVAGCTIEQGALGEGDAGLGPMGSDAATFADAGEPGDGGAVADGGAQGEKDAAATPCLPLGERCNGRDDDCDGEVDEDACGGCMVDAMGERAYVLCVTTLSWSAARAWCRDQGLDLVVVDDLEEDRAIWTRARTLRAADWWIGLDDRESEGVYRWVDGKTAWDDGTALGFTNFRGGVPADQPARDCVALRASSDGEWEDLRCDDPLGFVCEGGLSGTPERREGER